MSAPNFSVFVRVTDGVDVGDRHYSTGTMIPTPDDATLLQVLGQAGYGCNVFRTKPPGGSVTVDVATKETFAKVAHEEKHGPPKDEEPGEPIKNKDADKMGDTFADNKSPEKEAIGKDPHDKDPHDKGPHDKDDKKLTAAEQKAADAKTHEATRHADPHNKAADDKHKTHR